MNSFLVGGAVRDSLMGVEPKDRDFVVIGRTIEEMLADGFKQVGNDFPVFLHPETGEEFALARTERRSGRGHTGFAVVATPDVTLEQDLERRDLTINAMAMTAEGALVDPHGGAQDLRARVLRHVSPAFADDPLRVLRVARFAARFGFTVAPETVVFMRMIVNDRELEELTAERVCAEMIKALQSPKPSLFFRVLELCGALKVVLPELHALIGVPQPPQHHPEGDAFEHAMQCVDQIGSVPVRFAALVHDLGKAATPKELLPRHPGHDKAGVPIVSALCDRLRVTAEMKELAVMATELHMRAHAAVTCGAKGLVRLLRDADAFRRKDRFDDFLKVVIHDSRGRTGFERVECPEIAVINLARVACAQVDCAPIALAAKSKDQIRPAIDAAMAQAVSAAKVWP